MSATISRAPTRAPGRGVPVCSIESPSNTAADSRRSAAEAAASAGGRSNRCNTSSPSSRSPSSPAPPRGEPDIALVGVVVPEPPAGGVRIVVDEPVVAVMAPGEMLPTSGRTTLPRPRGSGLRGVLERACAEAGSRPRIAFEAATPLLLAQLAARTRALRWYRPRVGRGDGRRTAHAGADPATRPGPDRAGGMGARSLAAANGAVRYRFVSRRIKSRRIESLDPESSPPAPSRVVSCRPAPSRVVSSAQPAVRPLSLCRIAPCTFRASSEATYENIAAMSSGCAIGRGVMARPTRSQSTSAGIW